MRASADARANNFDLVRLLAALQVVVFHAMEHLGLGSAAGDAFHRVLGWLPGVPIFFVVSGFLISLSFENTASPAQYVRNRCLRIFPALWVCFLAGLATVFLWGFPLERVPTVTAVLAWVAAQLSVLQFFNPDFLRGYGVGVLNGSLWTIPVELQFYFMLPCIYWMLGLRHGARNARLIVLSCAVLVCSIAGEAYRAAHPGTILAKGIAVSLAPYLYMFLFGVIVQRNFRTLQPLFRGKAAAWLLAYVLWCLGASLLGLEVGSNTPNPIGALLLGGLTISCAFTRERLASWLLRGNDISYGIYIYHMLVINSLVELGYRGALWQLVAMVSATAGLAYVSWRWVERPFLRKKLQSLRAASLVTL